MIRFAQRLSLHILLLVLCASALTADVLVPAGSTWRYRDNGANQGTAWRGIAFNDAGWQSGAAQLGYGDGDEVTTVSYGPNENAKHVTTYFRRSFNVSNPAAYTSLLLSTLRDDGAIVYLNGVEVWRSDNMPSGAVNYQTLASWALGTPEEATFYDANLPSSLLAEGTNVLAVEVHQADVTSTDLSFDLRLQALTTYSVTRGPYLQMGTPASITVRWRTNAATDSRVRYGTSAENLAVVVDDATLTTEHVVTLNGLTPATTYFYSVGSTTQTLSGDASHTFLTSPTTGTSVPTRIWVLGDSGAANFEARAVRDAYLAYPGAAQTNLWLMLGDNAYEEGTDAEYQAAVFDMHAPMLRRTVLWPTIGNHDTAQSDVPPPTLPYLAMFTLPTAAEAGGTASGTEKYYSFDYGNIHFVCLDSMSSNRTAGSPMLTWLENDLASTTQPWIIAFWHHPPYTKGSHDSDLEDELIEIRENVLPVLESYGVDLVLCGHSHAYERSYLLDGHYGPSNTFTSAMKVDGGSGRPEETGAYRKSASGPGPHEGVVYAIAGSGSINVGGPFGHPAMFLSMSQLGSLVLDVNGNRLDAKFLRSTGAVADSFTILKESPATPPLAPSALAATATSASSINLTWTDNATNEADFRLERCTGDAVTCDATPALFAAIAEPAADATSYSDTALAPGTTYSYRLRAENAQGNSAYTSTATATTNACTYGVAPQSFTFPASGGSDSVTIAADAGCAWESSESASWITIDSGASGSGNGTTTFTVGANDGTARNATMTVAGTTVSIAQEMTAPPATPTNVNAQSIASNTIRVTWDAVANAADYEILRASAGSPFSSIGVATSAQFDDDTVAANTAYRYVVRARNVAGVSGDSAGDLATSILFTDGTLPVETPVKLVHLTERRNAVNAVRALAGLSAYSFTGGVGVRAVHINELRTALDQALVILGLPTGGYTGSITTGTKIRAIHFREIASRVQ